MDSHLINHGENKRRVPGFLCTYCRKLFRTRQARRNHLSVHQEEIQLRRHRYCTGCSSNPTDNNGNTLIASTNFQPENLCGGTRQNLPFEGCPSSFSHNNSANISRDSAHNLANGNSHLIAPSNPSSDGGATEIHHSNYLSLAPAAQFTAEAASVNPPIAFPSDLSSFGGGCRVSLSTAVQGQTSQGPVNSLQNHQYCAACSGNPTNINGDAVIPSTDIQPENNNGDTVIPSTDIQPENLCGGTRQNLPLLNLEDCPSSFSRGNSMVNVRRDTADNLVNSNSYLIEPSNLSSDGGSYLFLAPAAHVSAGTTFLNPPIAFPFDPFSFGGESRVSLSAAVQVQTPHGSVNPLQNHQYLTLRNKMPYFGDIGEDAQMTNLLRRKHVMGSHARQPLQPEERSKKELLLFKDVSGIVVLSDAEEEVQIDLDLSLHL